MRLLSTDYSNPKVKKSAAGTNYRIASLSMAPDDLLCPNRKVARCDLECLFFTGRGQMESVKKARRAKTKYWHQNRLGFIEQITRELVHHVKFSKKNHLVPAARLNVLSDIPWELYGIPQLFAPLGLKLYDYTKVASRLLSVPDNYKLIFSYSGAPDYQREVDQALETGKPIAVTFRGGLPSEFLGREVIDGDKSDLYNLAAHNKIVGLKLKGGIAIQQTKSPFVVDNPEMRAAA